MRLILAVKRKCSFFWLRGIHDARIDKCCAKCFKAKTFSEVYDKTRFKETALVELEIPFDSTIKVYYLCGLSLGFVYDDNTHVAFVPCEGQNVTIENNKIRLEITDARQIDFQNYQPNPTGEFTHEQRTCRNWIFANYLLDGMPL